MCARKNEEKIEKKKKKKAQKKKKDIEARKKKRCWKVPRRLAPPPRKQGQGMNKVPERKKQHFYQVF